MTLADVGRAAGVSAVVVSTVLNGSKSSTRVSPTTRERILKVAADLRYRPNAAARALVVRRMQTVGIAAVFDGAEFDHYFLEVFNGILGGATRHGHYATVFTLQNWAKDCEQLPSFCDGRVDGLILIAPLFGPDVARELPKHLPFVSLHANHVLPGVVNLESDEETGAHTLVQHLVSLGHRRILHLSGPRGQQGPERRIRGYNRALTEARIPLKSTWVVETDYSVRSGRLAMQSWLYRYAGRPLPQAIFCASDRVAMGCIEVLSEAGFKVPEDVSVAGFDDIIGARTTVPQLTTVRQPLRDMGSRAVDVLMQQLAHRRENNVPASPDLIVFPTELIQRASVAPPPNLSKLIPARPGFSPKET